MHGNAGEWTADWFDPNYYATAPLTDPRGPPTGTKRVIRAGGWLDYSAYCRSARKIGGLPSYRDHNIGFRVVLEP